MRLHLCGVRGSTPAPGPSFVRVGGDTSCVAVAHDEDEAPRLLLDAGTGLRNVAALMAGAPFEGSLLIGHLHWDHTQGLPFFTAGDRPDARVEVHLPTYDAPPGRTLDPLMSPPFFPISVDGLRGEWSFHPLEEGWQRAEDFDVLVREIPHPGGRTFGFRVTDGSRTMAYLSDHGPVALGPGPEGWGPYHEAAMTLVDGVDVLLHDAQHTEAELAARPHFGHSCVDYAVALAERCHVDHLVLYHHDPGRTDEQVDALVEYCAGRAVKVSAARQVDTVNV